MGASLYDLSGITPAHPPILTNPDIVEVRGSDERQDGRRHTGPDQVNRRHVGCQQPGADREGSGNSEDRESGQISVIGSVSQ